MGLRFGLRLDEMSLVFGRKATLLIELPSQDLVPKLSQPPFLQIGELAGTHLKLGEHRLFGLSSVHPSGDLGQDFQRELATFGHLLGGMREDLEPNSRSSKRPEGLPGRMLGRAPKPAKVGRASSAGSAR